MTGSAQVPGVPAGSHRQRFRTSSVHMITSYFCFDDPLGNELSTDYFHITHMRRLYYLQIQFWGHRGNSAKYLCSIRTENPRFQGFKWEAPFLGKFEVALGTSTPGHPFREQPARTSQVSVPAVQSHLQTSLKENL